MRTVLVLMMAGALMAQDLHFKTRTIQPISRPDFSRHKIIQFDHLPGVEDLDSLLKDGLQVVGAMPDNAVVVAAPGGQVPDRPGVRWIGRIDPADKLSADLAPSSDAALALVEFHADVTPAQQ